MLKVKPQKIEKIQTVNKIKNPEDYIGKQFIFYNEMNAVYIEGIIEDYITTADGIYFKIKIPTTEKIIMYKIA